ncbi:hypothetical protein ACFC0C_35475 [Streptomyces sp. NPDC056178]
MNLYAPGDIVALSQGMASVAPAVRDERAANGVADVHSALS